MPFTYTQPGADGTFALPKDEVRYLARDTVEMATSAQDSEVMYQLATWGGDKYFAAAALADQRAAAYEALAASSGETKTVGNLTIGKTSYDATAKGYRELANALRARGGDGSTVIVPMLAEVDPRPVFTLGMNDMPGTGLAR